MSLEKQVLAFAKKWAQLMSKYAPVGKRPRSKSAVDLYPDPLHKSIEVISGPEPLIKMNLYGIFVDQGTRYIRGSSITPFIDKCFDKAAEDAGEEITDAAFEKIGVLFDKTFK